MPGDGLGSGAAAGGAGAAAGAAAVMASADAFATAVAEGSMALLAVPQSLRVWLAAAQKESSSADVLDTVQTLHRQGQAQYRC